MLRNKEIRFLLMSLISISIAGIISAFIIHPLSGFLFFVLCALLISCTLIFNIRRYQKIKKLADYLKEVSNGKDSMDIRDNQEGELSILKNEIYKVTLMLSKQGDYLREDKKKLADALSDISHQLKTPLTSMTVMTDLLSQESLPSSKRLEFTKHIEKQLERMSWLLDSLLKMSKIDAGTVQFKKETVSVKEMIDQAVHPLMIPIELKEQQLIIEGKENVVFKGDLNWTSEALINVLKNCVEHTDKGGTVTISFAENPLYTEIKIEDNGKGIDKKDLPYVFKRFYKGENAGEESVGIGLAMAKSIIQHQQGSISVKSQLQAGTQFRIKFPKN